MTPAVAFEEVSFRYPEVDRPVLDRVDLALDEGSFALVVGPTGSGKSTVLRAVNGLVPHFTGGRMGGRVTVAGRDTRSHPPRRLADAVGFVPQDPDASFVLDRVEDEIAYVMENLAVDPRAMRARVEETLDLLRLESLRARRLDTLSGGERQRVAIAAALAGRPSVLVLDEPTSQLDPQGAEDVLAALQRLVHDLGLTVVLAEHRTERVAGSADVAVGCAGDGSVVCGDPAVVLDAVGSGPPVARLGRVLGWDPAPLTVRDARRRVVADPPRPIGRSSPSPGDALVRAEGLWAAYGDRVVLRAVDVEARAGEVVAVMGRNGAGKTTLLRCLAGRHAPSRGTIAGRGRSAPRLGVDVALCPQEPDSVLFADTVEGEVRATLEARAARDDPARWLYLVGMGAVARRHPRDLSAGERMLVALAAIAATGAPALLFDEPTRGLDPATKERLVEVLRRHASGGGAVLIATHDVETAAEVADRVVLLAGGEVIEEGPPERVIGSSPVFAPQTARVLGPEWLTPGRVATALAERGP